MRSILTITTAASSLLLLTDAELRLATGIASGQDEAHTALNKSIAAAITSRCNVAAAGVAAPTLMQETLTQTFRMRGYPSTLILARRPIVEIVSVAEDGASIDPALYEIEAGTGFLLRLCGDFPSRWTALKVTVVYKAGWPSVPENLRLAASKLAKVLWSESAAGDPSAKSISIPGVIDVERWVAPSDDPLMSGEIDELLGDYINPAMA